MRKKDALQVRLPEDMKNKLEALAEERDMRLSVLIRESLSKTIDTKDRMPEDIRYQILSTVRDLYIRELKLDGFRVLDVSKEIFEAYRPAGMRDVAENEYIMIIDRKQGRAKIWLETPPPFMTEGQIVFEDEQFVNLLKSPFFKEEDLAKSEIELKQKLLGVLKQYKQQIKLNFQPDQKYLQKHERIASTMQVLQESEKGMKVDLQVTGKDPDELARKTAEMILNLAFNQPLPAYMPIPVSIKQLRDTLLLIVLDRFSSEKIKSMNDADYDDFVRFMAHAAYCYFFDIELVKNDVWVYASRKSAVLKFSMETVRTLEKAVQNGQVRDMHNAVCSAFLFGLQKLPQETMMPNISVSKDRPSIGKALREGIYKNPGEVVEEALNLLERRLSH